MKKGDIVLVPFPFTDLSGQKVRPAVVLHTAHGEDCIVAFISSQQKSPTVFDILLSPSAQNGLKVASLLKVNKIATLEKDIVVGKLGTLETASLERVSVLLKKLFTLP